MRSMLLVAALMLLPACEDSHRTVPRPSATKPAAPPPAPPSAVVQRALSGTVDLRGRTLPVLLLVDSLVDGIWDLQYAKHPDYTVIRDSLRPLLARHYAPRAREAIARVPDLDRFIERYLANSERIFGISASGPALGVAERFAIAEIEEAGRWSEYWAPAADTAAWFRRFRYASYYESWKRDTRNTGSAGTGSQARLTRRWYGLMNSSLYSPEFLPNGRLGNGGGRWWVLPGTTVKSGRRYDVLCVQRSRGDQPRCEDYLVDRALAIDGGGLLLYWGNELYEER